MDVVRRRHTRIVVDGEFPVRIDQVQRDVRIRRVPRVVVGHSEIDDRRVQRVILGDLRRVVRLFKCWHFVVDIDDVNFDFDVRLQLPATQLLDHA